MTHFDYFDGHNDLLLRLSMKEGGSPFDFLCEVGQSSGEGHLDLPRIKKGGMVGGLYAMFCPPDLKKGASLVSSFAGLPPMLPQERAQYWVDKQIALFAQINAQSEGQTRHCLTAAEIRSTIAAGQHAMVLHLEGAEAIGPDLAELHQLYAKGLRSLGPVWSRPTIFGTGVPLKFPGSPDQGEGLTPVGIDLVRACNQLGVLIDLSHMNEKGFWDVARVSDAPLIATHSNTHLHCAAPRNLTDKQLEAIADSDGFVGLNLGVLFLRQDGQMKRDTPVTDILRHFDHLIEKLGEDRVGIGSDFDGVAVPNFISDVTGMPKLFDAMLVHGYGPELVGKIASKNWINALERVWGA